MLPATRPLRPNQIAAVLIRTQVKYPAKPEEWTRFLTADGQTSSKKGAHVFIDGKLHRYRQQEKKSPNPPCEGDPVNIFPTRILRNAAFVPEKKGDNIEVIKFYKPDPNREAVPVEIEHELVAALPGFAFIKTSITDYGCGVHPLYGRKFRIVAFGSNGTFDDVDGVDYTEGSDTRMDKAIEKFNAEVAPSEAEDSLDGRVKRSDVSVTMAYPTFTRQGADWTLLYTAPSTWVGSYGGWAGYTRSVPVALEIAPPRFREAMVIPEVITAYVAKHEKDEEIFGYTLGETNDEKK